MTHLDYKSAGVDIQAGNELVNKIKSVTKKTHGPNVLSSLGGFAGLYDLTQLNLQEPVLVSGTDGVGTKLKLANKLNRHDTIGIDLVAMCVNDIIVCGARPLFFLDYFATGKLKPDLAAEVITGIAKGCELSGAALIGGETAEMPGMYQGEDYDLAGFAVGVVEKSKIIDGAKVKAGDALIAIASSGAHSNGYSLIRKIIETSNASLTDTKIGDQSLGDLCLQPTRIYVSAILKLQQQFEIKAMAHITGGGLIENLPRVLPDNITAKIDTTSWQMPALFQWLQKQGNILDNELYKTFNCGVGMVLCVNAKDVAGVLKTLQTLAESAWQIGEIVPKTDAAITLV